MSLSYQSGAVLWFGDTAGFWLRARVRSVCFRAFWRWSACVFHRMCAFSLHLPYGLDALKSRPTWFAEPAELLEIIIANQVQYYLGTVLFIRCSIFRELCLWLPCPQDFL